VNNRELFNKLRAEGGQPYREMIFNQMSKPDILHSFSGMILKKYKKGDIIFTENQAIERIYFIKSGRVFLKSVDVDGNEFIYNVVLENDFFGLSSMIDAHTMASAQAACDCEVYSLEANVFNEILLKNPQMCLFIVKFIVKKFRASAIRSKNIAAKDSKRLFSTYIISLIMDRGIVKEDDSIIVYNDLTNEEISNLLGVSRETLSRVFNHAKKEGLIDYNRKEIKVLDLDGLINYSD
jgi:CRP/FNR family transcriptional regulator